MSTFFDELTWRGLVNDYTRFAASENPDQAPQLPELLASRPVTLYCGFDPTAESLHVGSLVPLIALRRFQLAGHHPIAVAGGATGSIGDPSGKTNERKLLTAEEIRANVRGIRGQLARLLDFETPVNPARLVDNADWIQPIGIIDFLRDVGKHFSVNQMMAKESVRARLEDRETGLSFTEFSYMLLQAFDFYHLAERHGCDLQIGGSDQWGNITAGIDLMRRKLRRQGYGLTLPLISKADGTKFGKSESGAVWLDARLTSVYKFHQFWIQTDDRDVVKFLKYFTFLSREAIDALAAAHEANPGKREAHQALAREMTRLLHGEAAGRAAEEATAILFGGEVDRISRESLEMLMGEIPVAAAPAETGVIDALVACGLAASRGQARKDIEGGGVYINGARCASPTQVIEPAHFLHGIGVLLRKGKKAYAVLHK